LDAPTSIQTTVLPCLIVTRAPYWSLRVPAIQVKGRRRASYWASRRPDDFLDYLIGHLRESHEVRPDPSRGLAIRSRDERLVRWM
jgi:hypothetical protein